MMGHASEIISIDIYTDSKKIATDCLTELEPFIETVKPESKEANLMTVVENDIVQMNDFIQKMLEKIE